ncbi:MAG: hypothetical protein IKV36_01680 [Clostridia bacterium]|nr:hypothetical protein [Clostridia bacterium]
MNKRVFINKVKDFFRENKLTSAAFRFLKNIRKRDEAKRKQQKRETLQKNGIALVHLIQDLLAEEFFHFDMGTLLGIIREGRLLGHDIDVDIALHIKGKEGVTRIREVLESKGCQLNSSFCVDEIGVVEDSFYVMGIKFDVAYYFEKEDKDVTYLMYKNPYNPPQDGFFNVVELSCSPIRELTQVDFGGKMINVPKESEKYLAERYGENWRIPDKNYIYWKGPSTKPTDYIGRKTTYNS